MFVDIKSSIKSTIYDFHLLHPRQWFGNIYAACLNEKEKKKWKTKILFLKIGWSPKRSRQRYALNRRRKRSSFAQLFQIILPPSFHAYLSRQIIDIHTKQIGLAGEILQTISISDKTSQSVGEDKSCNHLFTSFKIYILRAVR